MAINLFPQKLRAEYLNICNRIGPLLLGNCVKSHQTLNCFSAVSVSVLAMKQILDSIALKDDGILTINQRPKLVNSIAFLDKK